MNARLKRVAKATPRYAVMSLMAGCLLRLLWSAIGSTLPEVGVHTADELRALAVVVTCCSVAFVLMCQLPSFARALLRESAQPSDRESTT
jgi:hypothetical protein